MHFIITFWLTRFLTLSTKSSVCIKLKWGINLPHSTCCSVMVLLKWTESNICCCDPENGQILIMRKAYRHFFFKVLARWKNYCPQWWVAISSTQAARPRITFYQRLLGNNWLFSNYSGVLEECAWTPVSDGDLISQGSSGSRWLFKIAMVKRVLEKLCWIWCSHGQAALTVMLLTWCKKFIT